MKIQLSNEEFFKFIKSSLHAKYTHTLDCSEDDLCISFVDSRDNDNSFNHLINGTLDCMIKHILIYKNPDMAE